MWAGGCSCISCVYCVPESDMHFLAFYTIEIGSIINYLSWFHFEIPYVLSVLSHWVKLSNFPGGKSAPYYVFIGKHGPDSKVSAQSAGKIAARLTERCYRLQGGGFSPRGTRVIASAARLHSRTPVNVFWILGSIRLDLMIIFCVLFSSLVLIRWIVQPQSSDERSMPV